MEIKDALQRYDIAKVLLDKIEGDLSGKKLLDVGCGTGNMLLAAANRNAQYCLGIDLKLNDYGDNHLNEIAQLNQIDISKIKMMEGLFEVNNFPSGCFDVVTLIDSIEHMENPEMVIAEISRVLKPGGLFLLNVSPLYYSQLGHHLFNYFSREEYPWVHLYKNFDELLHQFKVQKWSLDHFYQLNKITSNMILEYTKIYGIEIVNFSSVEIGKDIFSSVKEKLDPSQLPSSIDDLFIESNTILFIKRNQPPSSVRINAFLQKWYLIFKNRKMSDHFNLSLQEFQVNV